MEKKPQYKLQKVKDGAWSDEKGMKIPVNRLNPLEKLKEKACGIVLPEAIKINKSLVEFKEKVQQLCNEVYETEMDHRKNENRTKGNFTFFNFDRSIKIEVSINDRIAYDDLAIQSCRDKLDTFLDQNVAAKDQFIKDLILDAFRPTNGKLDPKRVNNLLTYESKIKDPLFQDALKDLKDSIRRPSSKTYFRIWAKDEDGSYQAVELNFAAI